MFWQNWPDEWFKQNLLHSRDPWVRARGIVWGTWWRRMWVNCWWYYSCGWMLLVNWVKTWVQDIFVSRVKFIKKMSETCSWWNRQRQHSRARFQSVLDATDHLGSQRQGSPPSGWRWRWPIYVWHPWLCPWRWESDLIIVGTQLVGKAHGKSLVVGAGSQTSVAAQVVGLSLGMIMMVMKMVMVTMMTMMTMMVMVTAEIIRL